MRILHVTWLVCKDGGLKRYVRSLAAAQMGLGHDVLIAAGDGKKFDEREDPHLRVAAIPTMGALVDVGYGLLSPIEPARAAELVAEQLTSVIDAFRPDILHIHDVQRYSPALADALPSRLPTINTVHTNVLNHRHLPEVAARAWDVQIAVSEAALSIIPSSSKSRLLSGYTGIDGRLFFPSLESVHIDGRIGDLDGPVLFHPAARFNKIKAPDVVLQAFHMVKEAHPNASVIFPDNDVSKPDDWVMENVLRPIARSPHYTSIRRMGFSNDGMGDALRAVAKTNGVVLHPSRAEALSLALLEALACGVPAVATAIGGQPEALANGAAGLLVPPDDPAALAEGALRLIEDGQTRGRMVANGLRHAEGFQMKRVAADLVELYTATIGHKRQTIDVHATEPSAEADQHHTKGRRTRKERVSGRYETVRPRASLALDERDTIVEVSWRSHAPDTNGDGIGDCRGLLKVLPVIKKMGFTAMRVAPFFATPRDLPSDHPSRSRTADNGYDVVDHFAVDPDFGSMEDVLELGYAAQYLGIKLLLDIVPSHTSSRHPMFEDALRYKDSRFRDWYVFQESLHGSDQPPTNACSVFARDPNAEGSAWERNPHRPGEWYLHQFLPDQPQLNGSNPKVQGYFADVLKWWAERGFSGAHFDAGKYFAVNSRVRTEDNPRVRPNDPRPYHRWDHGNTVDAHDDSGYNLSAVALGYVIRGVRQHFPGFYAFHEHDNLTQESLDAYSRQGLDTLDAVKGGPDVSISYVPRKAEQIAATMQGRLERARAGINVVGFDRSHKLPSWAASNPLWVKDPTQPDPHALRQLATLLMTSPSGAPVMLYGIPNGTGITDRVIQGTENDPRTYRDLSFRPVGWGLSELPVADQNHVGETRWEDSVMHQLQNPESYLNFVRGLMALRSTLSTNSQLVFHSAQDGLLDYSVGKLRVMANVGDAAARVDWPQDDFIVGYQQGIAGDKLESGGLRISWDPTLELDTRIRHSNEFETSRAVVTVEYDRKGRAPLSHAERLTEQILEREF
jgi:glycosidase/glycosyltransferase involved in cell wall biosynthesis